MPRMGRATEMRDLVALAAHTVIHAAASPFSVRCLSSICEMKSLAFDGTPTTRWASLPSRKRTSVGIALMPKREELSTPSSTFSLTTFSLSSYFSASDSTVGASILQGGHHAAQKSTSTGWDDFKTSLSKFVSLTSVTYSLIDLSFHIMIIIL